MLCGLDPIFPMSNSNWIIKFSWDTLQPNFGSLTLLTVKLKYRNHLKFYDSEKEIMFDINFKSFNSSRGCPFVYQIHTSVDVPSQWTREQSD